MPPPPPPPPPPTVAPPAGTSSPARKSYLPLTSPVSDVEVPVHNTSKLNIIMPDNTINASALASSAGITSPIHSVEIDEQCSDADLPEDDPNLDLQSQNGNTSHTAPKTFPENVIPLPHISTMRRVSTAYKYADIPRQVIPPKKAKSEAHGSDEEKETPDDIREVSFPISSYITESWQSRSKAFKRSLKEALIMDQPQEPEANSAQTGEAGASEDAKKKDKKSVYSKTHPMILKNKPINHKENFSITKKNLPCIQNWMMILLYWVLQILSLANTNFLCNCLRMRSRICKQPCLMDFMQIHIPWLI